MKPIEKLRLGKKRSMLLSDVSGDVLEIGFGTGVNLGYYPYEQIDSLNLMDMDLPKHLTQVLFHQIYHLKLHRLA